MNRRQTKDRNGHHWTDKAADKIAFTGIWLQTSIASYMNKRLSKLSNRYMIAVLVVFCFAGGGFSIYLAGNAIFGMEEKQTVLEVKRISTPRHFDKTGTEVIKQDQDVPEYLYQQIQSYKRYMDSTGQLISKERSDSILLLEQIYHSQKIK
ncbi:MAG: hypothetical protein GXC73_09050 [Chitinophagaceae bacterium]|nr:hypothetical protein [Chitinophagaceae bacterium]